ncbi:uncharacterized protein LOC110847779 [Folsomia candida]|nr:uncharacterized protein LOC110847779 [Folsomia candida]
MEVTGVGDQSYYGGNSGGGLEELSPAELESHLAEGMFRRVNNHREHLVLQPFWLTRPKQGVIEEIRKMLGKWNARLEAYVVGFENPVCESTTGAINEDHRWIHVDIVVTFYLYQPVQGQHLRGIVKKKGHQAAICILFNVFSATVYPLDQVELDSWSLGDEIHFTIQSFQNRRKGPVIKATSSNDGTTSKKKKMPDVEESWE